MEEPACALLEKAVPSAPDRPVDMPVLRMVSAGPQPEPGSTMMRARQTCFCMLRGLPMICSRRARSSPDSLISCLVDFLPIDMFLFLLAA